MALHSVSSSVQESYAHHVQIVPVDIQMVPDPELSLTYPHLPNLELPRFTQILYRNLGKFRC